MSLYYIFSIVTIVTTVTTVTIVTVVTIALGSQVLQALVRAHQEKRAAVTEAEIDHFMSLSKFSAAPVGNSTSAPQQRSPAEVEAYLKKHNVTEMLNRALADLVAEMPADPKEVLSRHFK